MRQSNHRLQISTLQTLGHPAVQQVGFTLIELIVTLILLGILSVYALPRLLAPSDFYAFGFHGETLSYLRYAQKTAIAQRRTVCVAFSASSVTLTIAANFLPGWSSKIFILLVLGRLFTWAGTGTPQSTQTILVNSVTRSITVEGATGYAHE